MKLMTITTDEEFVDPYDHMTDEEFNEMVDGLMAKQRAIPIGLRMEPALLGDIKAIAAELRVPYQTLMKEWLTQAAAAFRKRQARRSAAHK
jgi:predicted DNA binding CopG/RHH family protein